MDRVVADCAMSQVVQRNAAAIRRLLVIVPVALLIFYLVNPPIWYEPLEGSETTSTAISIAPTH